MIKEVIGDAVLYLVDCRDILPMIGKVDAVITDPPYGMNFQSNHRGVAHEKIHDDHNDDLLIWACHIEASHSKYIFYRWDNLLGNIPKPKSCITWVKNNWSMGDLRHEHGRMTEIAMFYDGHDHSWPDKRPSDVIYAERTGNNYHPTEKPVYLMEQVVKWTKGVVVDPFMGSGTTGVAAMNLKRKFIGIEREEKYFEIACKRIEDAQRQENLF